MIVVEITFENCNFFLLNLKIFWTERLDAKVDASEICKWIQPFGALKWFSRWCARRFQKSENNKRSWKSLRLFQRFGKFITAEIRKNCIHPENSRYVGFNWLHQILKSIPAEVLRKSLCLPHYAVSIRLHRMHFSNRNTGPINKPSSRIINTSQQCVLFIYNFIN